MNAQEPAPFHTFAWDGLSFPVPADWNLAAYEVADRVTSLRMEDDVAVRLEADWTRPPTRVDAARVEARFAKRAAALERIAEATEEAAGLPPGWTARLYQMPENRRLAVAYHLSAAPPLFLFLQLHFAACGRNEPKRVLAALAAGLRDSSGPVLLWSVYDVSFRLRRDFRLARTSFLAGRKQFTFDWRLRRLYLWFVSLADVALRGRAPAEWAVEFLNRQAKLPGTEFFLASDRAIRVRHSSASPFGHFEEIGRWAFRYHVVCRHIPDRNMLALAVFHHRGADDMAMLDGMDLDAPPQWH